MTKVANFDPLQVRQLLADRALSVLLPNSTNVEILSKSKFCVGSLDTKFPITLLSVLSSLLGFDSSKLPVLANDALGNVLGVFVSTSGPVLTVLSIDAFSVLERAAALSFGELVVTFSFLRFHSSTLSVVVINAVVLGFLVSILRLVVIALPIDTFPILKMKALKAKSSSSIDLLKFCLSGYWPPGSCYLGETSTLVLLQARGIKEVANTSNLTWIKKFVTAYCLA
ncbi:hypothetical protein FF38_06565 [Lucilia cuprina]|uniref:Uncharacterized protein n=1 Tax=Lucilia cuprina TaxID=7375 RepID=A0A0L0CB07_LUCCU|nr:hypothetical protein FF38_06565 [Lucilia cuprina]